MTGLCCSLFEILTKREYFGGKQIRQMLVGPMLIDDGDDPGSRPGTGLAALDNPLDCCQRESSFFCEFLWLHLEGRQHLGQVIG